MNFKEFLNEDGEDGSVGTADVCVMQSTLFSQPIKRRKPRIKIKKIFEANNSTIDVKSKIDDAKRKSDITENSAIVGIEDKSGNVTKVYIQSDQEDAFTDALKSAVSDEDQPDIVEILFNLRNTFNILYVEWAEVEEDTEVDNKLDSPENQEEQPENQTEQPENQTDQQPGNQNGAADQQPDEDAGDGKSLILKIIDMLKADAEAKAEDAKARAKEAEAEQAKHATTLAQTKVKSEEDILNAENFFKQQKDQKREADRLTMLAKYRQEIAQQRNESLNEDINTLISNGEARIADLNVRKARAVKVYDDQIKMLQTQLASQRKQANTIAMNQSKQPAATAPAQQSITQQTRQVR
jgi:hypothetical protein